MFDFFKSTGKIIYDPYRGDMRNRITNWVVLDVDSEITRYCRWWLKFERHIHLQQPAWDAHVSIIRGEKIPLDKRDLWKKYHGKTVEFEWGGQLQTSTSELDNCDHNRGLFYFVDVKCAVIDNIRAEIGLRTGWMHHLTIGRTYEYEARKPKRLPSR